MVDSVKKERSVLLVAESEDAREVLSTALSRRGIAVMEMEEGADTNGPPSPDVDLVLIDIESDGPHAEPLPSHIELNTEQAKSAQLLILGAAHLPADDLCRAHVVSKPYHYGALIRKIEEMLAAS